MSELTHECNNPSKLTNTTCRACPHHRPHVVRGKCDSSPCPYFGDVKCIPVNPQIKEVTNVQN